MELIGAAFANDIRDRSASTTKLSRICVGENYHFLHGVHIVGLQCLSLDRVVVIVLAIQKKIISARTRAVHGKSRTVAYVVAANVDDSGLGECQRDHIAVEDRKVLGFHGFDSVLQRSTLGLKIGGAGGYFDGVTHRAY